MKKYPDISSERLILRPFEAADAPEVQRLAGDYEVARYTLNIPHPYEDGMAEEWLERHKKEMDAGRQVTYAITLREDGKLIGAISMVTKFHDAKAEMGYWIGRPYWNKGYCTEAVRAFIEFGFSELMLHKIFAMHMVGNEASGRVMEKAGMTFEGCLRQHDCKDGVWHDMNLYGILKQEIAASQKERSG